MAHPLDEQPDPRQVATVVEAALSASPVSGPVVVVSIDGRSGAGKTVLAGGVGAALGCPVVHLDDIFPGWDGLAEGVTLVTEQVLAPISRGEPAAYRRWDWMRSRPGRTVSVPATTHLVIEGCGALVSPAAEYAAVRVWIDAPEAVRKARALARDGSTYAPHWDRWAAQEDIAYAGGNSRAHAHLLLAGG